jgi:hypothetical protein
LGVFLGYSISLKFTLAVTLATGIILFLISSLNWFKAGEPTIKKIGKWDGVVYSSILLFTTITTYYIIISPALLSPENTVKLALALEAKEGHLVLFWKYMTKTLPSGLGWPVYLMGAIGVISTLLRYHPLTIRSATLLITALIFMVALILDPIGTMPQRSLTVYALWIIFATWGIQVILNFLVSKANSLSSNSKTFLSDSIHSQQGLISRKLGVLKNFTPIQWIRNRPSSRTVIHPILGIGMVFYVLMGGLLNSVLIDFSLLKDQPGYRTEVSRYVRNNIPAHSTLFLNVYSKHGHVDISMLENHFLSDSLLYHYEFLYPEQLLKNPRSGFALYPENWTGGEVMQTFHSALKLEPKFFRYARMLSGYHKADQLINAPSFSVYRVSE